MSNLDHFNKVVSEFDHCADFITVYITEAHPLEEWTLTDNAYNMKQHTNVEDRITAAKKLRDAGIACPVVIDTMENESVHEYGAFPEAFYIIEDSIVKLKCLGPFYFYNPTFVHKWIKGYLKRIDKQTLLD